MTHALALAHAQASATLRECGTIPEARAFAEKLGPMHAQERAILARWPEGMPYPPLPTRDDEKNMLLGAYDPRWWAPGSRDGTRARAPLPQASQEALAGGGMSLASCGGPVADPGASVAFGVSEVLSDDPGWGSVSIPLHGNPWEASFEP